MIDDWKTLLSNKELLFSLFINLKKAFDMINRDLLFLTMTLIKLDMACSTEISEPELFMIYSINCLLKLVFHKVQF